MEPQSSTTVIPPNSTQHHHHHHHHHYASIIIDGVEEDEILGKSEFLSREEVIRRRSRRVKQLQKCYKDHYWALMEDLRVRYRDYYWKFGKGPYKDEEEMGVDGLVGNFVGEESGENNGGRVGFGVGENGGCSGSGGGGGVGGDDVMIKRCVFALCKSKAMALTNYCHTHILADARQTLYTACIYNIKSAHTGPVHCGKPILKATVPSLCSVHFQKAQKHVARALKKAGLHIPLSSKLAPKFHVIVAESVRQINAKRRERRANAGKIVVNKKDNAS